MMLVQCDVFVANGRCDIEAETGGGYVCGLEIGGGTNPLPWIYTLSTNPLPWIYTLSTNPLPWIYTTTILAGLSTSVTAQAIGLPHTALETRCSLAEWPCRSDVQCVSLDRYCDGVRDCEDGSDEPPDCTRECILEMITHVFTSHTEKGCPDGHMQIAEPSRPLGAGYWCGTSWGSNVYYSETSAVALLLRVFNHTETPEAENQGGPNSEEAVLLRLSYRFLKKNQAVLRYGPPYRPYFLGKAVRRTYCDKFFDDCDQQNCKLQSPNYPGMYPRNLTCQYKVHQTHAPPGKVALVRLKQENPHLIYIKDKNAPHVKRDRKLALAENCDVLQDYIVIHDGNTTDAPILLKACKGGPLSSITASGPNILVLFHVSPFDFPFQDSPRRKIYGFQFDVEIMFVDSDSTAYIRRPSSILVLPPLLAEIHDPYVPCSWEMKSSGRRSGYVQAPEHSLLPNTSCTWRLSGGIGEVVWLSFLHYRHVIHKEIPKPVRCTNTLTIHDGATTNATMLANVCQTEKYPRVCGGGVSVACLPEDSYISNSPLLTITLHYAEGTIASHIEFLARFEFVRRRQWGLSTQSGNSCDRTFGSSPDRLFASPRDVFYFGRGGRKKLRCTYTFKGGHNQVISIRMLRSYMGDHCRTLRQGSSNRYECSNGGSDDYPSIWIVEDIWPGVPLRRACLCDVNRPITIMSYTSKVSFIFNVPHMTPRDDYTHYFFEGEYELLPAPTPINGVGCIADHRRYDIPHGNFTVGAGGLADACDSLPRLITPPDGGFLFLRVDGFAATEKNCVLGSRINVYGVGGLSPLSSICPEPGEFKAQVFSNGWERRPLYNRTGPLEPSRALIVEYTGNYSTRAVVNWISVWRPVTLSLTAPSVGCDHRCPEIGACLPQELMCNRIPDCPSEADETAAACGILAALPWATVVVAGTMLLALLILLIAVVTRRRPPRKMPMHESNSFDSLPKLKKSKDNKKKKKIKANINDFGGSIGKISNNSSYFTPSTKKPPSSSEDFLLPPDGAS
ncbi:uncharacterized protein LOC108669393 [Hyalella azteca]|uniref:Uncharacterized protein LOC108669393 n=2 Tax=Hyalella azteca TaxID=294128 RepID=A0A979FLE1_HYAAZ|nr:uncharacterized protein LOC108669393 [Hyalella azteca]